MDVISVWRDLTVGQALALGVSALVVLWLVDRLVGVVRELLGKPAPVDHCSHCEEVDALTTSVQVLVEVAADTNRLVAGLVGDQVHVRSAVEKLVG